MLLPTLFQLAGLASLATGNDDSAVIRRYLNAVRIQDEARRDMDTEVTIQARLPKLNRHAMVRTLRRISATGKISYKTLHACGDGMVRREVIARYLAVMSEEREIDEFAITPAHYRFRFAGTIEQPGRNIYVFRLTPRKKKVGLFKGELWVDGLTGQPVHEAGQFVKSPSIFIKKIVFTRDYETYNGLAISVHVRSTVESRLAGPAELDIRSEVERHVD